MESSVALRSFQCSVGSVSQNRTLLEKPGMVSIHNASWPIANRLYVQGLAVFPSKRKGILVSCVKTSEVTEIAKSNGSSDGISQGTLKKKAPPTAVFPTGFEALLLEVCDQTEVAELKLRVGDFEMHLKRNIETSKAAPVSFVSPTVAPPIPTKPMIESIVDIPPPAESKPTPKKTNSFTSSSEKSPKLAALEASGSNAYVLVSSPTVGSFRRARTLKGKKQPPACKEGDFIKEGQVIGFVDQFGTELPVKSDVAGEILKLLFVDGEAVGFGDPLIAVLPSFHGIK